MSKTKKITVELSDAELKALTALRAQATKEKVEVTAILVGLESKRYQALNDYITSADASDVAITRLRKAEVKLEVASLIKTRKDATHKDWKSFVEDTGFAMELLIKSIETGLKLNNIESGIEGIVMGFQELLRPHIIANDFEGSKNYIKKMLKQAIFGYSPRIKADKQKREAAAIEAAEKLMPVMPTASSKTFTSDELSEINDAKKSGSLQTYADANGLERVMTGNIALAKKINKKFKADETARIKKERERKAANKANSYSQNKNKGGKFLKNLQEQYAKVGVEVTPEMVKAMKAVQSAY